MKGKIRKKNLYIVKNRKEYQYMYHSQHLRNNTHAKVRTVRQKQENREDTDKNWRKSCAFTETDSGRVSISCSVYGTRHVYLQIKDKWSPLTTNWKREKRSTLDYFLITVWNWIVREMKKKYECSEIDVCVQCTIYGRTQKGAMQNIRPNYTPRSVLVAPRHTEKTDCLGRLFPFRMLIDKHRNKT